MPSLLGGKSRDAFGQPAFFLAGNRMTIVAFEKEVSLKSLSLFSKTIVRRYCSFKLKKKRFNTYKWKEKVQKNTGSRRKLQVTKAASKDLIALFSSRRRACLVLKHNRVSEVLFIHNSRSKHSHKATAQASLTANNCFQF